MRLLRSTVFNLAFYACTAILAIACLPLIAGPRTALVWIQTLWARCIVALMGLFAGITVEVRGKVNLPAGGCIVASKHQSAFDTLIWHRELGDPALVMKKELLLIPVYGWIAARSRMIAIDRAAGARALKQLVADSRAVLADRRPIVIFPQGTRTAPGLPLERAPYQVGIAALYGALDTPVVPVALNTGLYWPRRSWLRFRGRMVLQYLSPLPPGLPRRRFMAELTERIETATRRLEREGLAEMRDDDRAAALAAQIEAAE